MVQGSEDVGDGDAREGSMVPDGLYPGIRPPHLSERGRPEPEAQLRPSHGNRATESHPPKGTLALPWAHDAPPDMTARSSDEDAYGQDIF